MEPAGQPPSPQNTADESVNNATHPAPIGQRERSTSAPNVCYNLVGQPTEQTDDFLQKFAKGTYSTLHGNLQNYMPLSSELLFFHFILLFIYFDYM